MAEEIDDNDFIQQDFTTASEWENFNAKLEEVFLEWKLPFAERGRPLFKDEIFTGNWKVKKKSINFAEVELDITYYYLEITSDSEVKDHSAFVDLMSVQNNFQITGWDSNIHNIARWYGLRNFVLIESSNVTISIESQLRVLVSSACITVAETNTEVPVFVRALRKELSVYLGVCECPSTRINFDIVALETCPPNCKYLSGLLSMFKGKINANYVRPVTVSVQLSYTLKNFTEFNYRVKEKTPFCRDAELEPEDILPGGMKFFALPYGVSFDPIKSFILTCTWPEIAENVIVDSATYSDLDPKLAPVWSLRATFHDQLIYYLSEAITEYIKLLENPHEPTSQSKYTDVLLNSITESKITKLIHMPKTKKQTKEQKMFEGPIKDVELMQMLYYLFQDAQTDPLFPYEAFQNEKSSIKTSVPDSITFRLSSLLATCNYHFGGIEALGQLWSEFTYELRYRVEKCIKIPGIVDGFPDFRSSLLNQKLQILNVCIKRRHCRETGQSIDYNEYDSEDVFYDCDTDDEQDSLRYEGLNIKPEGRMTKYNNLKLIDSDDFLFVPVTQTVPKTEDQLDDDCEVMLKLGPGSELTGQMMSASLLSDMESFKAANPNGQFGDFIRWYSPRDWIEEMNELGNITGKLSQRMQIPGNTWQTLWDQAKPISAMKQKPLFDDVKASEEILKFFESRTIGQIVQMTTATLFHSAILKLQSCFHLRNSSNSEYSEAFKYEFEDFFRSLGKISHTIEVPSPMVSNTMTSTSRKFEYLSNEMYKLESLVIQSNSLIKKLASNPYRLSESEILLIENMLRRNEERIEGGYNSNAAKRIQRLFHNDESVKNEFRTKDDDVLKNMILPEPSRKEYILRVDGKTTDKGDGGPQFLRAILEERKMRLCGAFSENTMFV